MDDTTVSVLGKDGEPVVTVPLDEMGESPEFADALADGISRSAGDLEVLGPEQLSFDVGEGPDDIARPRLSTFGISGKLTSRDEQLLREDQVIVTITNPDGEIIARKLGKVTAVSFITHEPPDDRKWVERAHKVKVA